MHFGCGSRLPAEPFDAPIEQCSQCLQQLANGLHQTVANLGRDEHQKLLDQGCERVSVLVLRKFRRHLPATRRHLPATRWRRVFNGGFAVGWRDRTHRRQRVLMLSWHG